MVNTDNEKPTPELAIIGKHLCGAATDCVLYYS